ncbi:hypothetical protein PR048_007254 [Dryococelus australis]|uniref:Uncharacterized protein n=1 Tax=Dryococelus australis TaxID=614101 RepID=A0ABQ9ID36_9NEOP|nr:hypothetical protein PR048_007254 [Dryococelus australis]
MQIENTSFSLKTVCLLNAARPGLHWLAYVEKGNPADYYDSFGDLRPPPELREYLDNCNVTYNYKTEHLPNMWNFGHLCLHFLVGSYK